MDPIEEQQPAALPPPLPVEPEPVAVEQQPPAKPYPGFWQAVGLYLLYTLGTIVVIVPVGVADAIAKTTLMKNPWVLGLASLAGSLLAVHTARSRLKLSWRDLAGPFRLPAEIIPSIAVTIVGQVIVTLMVAFWLLRLFPSLMPSETYGLDKTLLGAAFTLMIAAPLGEELLFRGVLLRGFVPRYGLTRGIALGALMFAVGHMSLAKLFGTFMLGAIFGWWYTKMGSIWPGVIGHALNNGVPVLVVALLGKKSVTDNKLPPFSWAEPVFAIIGLALLAQGILAMRKFFDSQGTIPQTPASEEE